MSREISNWTRSRLKEQGYTEFADKELSNLKFGIRFAYILCGSLVLLGLLLKSIPILGIALIAAFFGSILKNHPFDYIYNSFLRQIINKPKLPQRANQGRFACGIATVWLIAIIYFLYAGMVLLAYVFGILLLVSAALVSSIDLCIPSIIYNKVIKK